MQYHIYKLLGYIMYTNVSVLCCNEAQKPQPTVPIFNQNWNKKFKACRRLDIFLLHSSISFIILGSVSSYTNNSYLLSVICGLSSLLTTRMYTCIWFLFNLGCIIDIGECTYCTQEIKIWFHFLLGSFRLLLWYWYLLRRISQLQLLTCSRHM